MTAVDIEAEAGPRALSCYTANLAAYLVRRDPAALDAIARSVHVAVRAGLPGDALAVSHHSTPLHALAPDGVLDHATSPAATPTLAGVTAELARHGQAIVVASSSRLPWSVASADAPHLLLVDGFAGGRWHVLDEFSALLPDGRQDPFAGWLTDHELLDAMAPAADPLQEHRLRDEHKFGVPVPPPTGAYVWLVLRPATTPNPRLPATWRIGAEALEELRGFWGALSEHPDRARFLDDMWAAAQHHTFRYARLLHVERPPDADAAVFRAAADAWRDLPMALRFAAQSSARGRARPALVHTTFDHLGAAEAAAQRLLGRYGYVGSS